MNIIINYKNKILLLEPYEYYNYITIKEIKNYIKKNLKIKNDIDLFYFNLNLVDDSILSFYNNDSITLIAKDKNINYENNKYDTKNIINFIKFVIGVGILVNI